MGSHCNQVSTACKWLAVHEPIQSLMVQLMQKERRTLHKTSDGFFLLPPQGSDVHCVIGFEMLL